MAMIIQDKIRCKLESIETCSRFPLMKGEKIPLILLILFTTLIPHLLRAEEADWCRHLPRPGYAKLQRINVPSQWFEVYLIRPGVFAISEPRQFEEVISYLIIGERRALLWDTGMAIARILPVVQHLTTRPVVVLNSHTHPDHIGGNFEFKEIWAVQTEFTQQNSKGYSDADLKSWVAPDQICGNLPSDFKVSTYQIRPYSISRFVKDGEKIDLGGRQLEVLHTPGHTPDSLCLLDREGRVLFTGDTFYAGPLYLYAPETNFDAFVISVNRLAQLANSVDVLLTGHNEPISPVSSLTSLQTAVEQIRSGEMKPMEKDGLNQYFFQHFSILMKKN
jgi:glyoxylase-like metal-dependent hydrolase (beta-lactamase superfamily II)